MKRDLQADFDSMREQRDAALRDTYRLTRERDEAREGLREVNADFDLVCAELETAENKLEAAENFAHFEGQRESVKVIRVEGMKMLTDAINRLAEGYERTNSPEADLAWSEFHGMLGDV